jgi:ethanolamine-phosphate cytidylyltransferase
LLKFADVLTCIANKLGDPVDDSSEKDGECERRSNESVALLASAGGHSLHAKFDAVDPTWQQVPSSLAPSPQGPSDGEVRIFVDGVFDLTHFGHMNAFRQARALGTYLVVGVNDDKSVFESKGSWPVLKNEEREVAVAACRFVDEIVPASPYVMSEEYIQDLIDNKGIDIFVHGDDPCIVNGRDVYESAKKAGRYQSVPRTEGVSTTDILARILLQTDSHHIPEDGGVGSESSFKLASSKSHYLVTSKLMEVFAARRPDVLGDTQQRVVYVDGSWDMFHAGHIDFLRQAKALGDVLLVGVHSDEVTRKHRGLNSPIMSMHERTLSVLGCRYVDDVLLDAPWVISQELISTLHVDLVAYGEISDGRAPLEGEEAPHALPNQLGIARKLQSCYALSVFEISKRLLARTDAFVQHVSMKQRKDRERFNTKHGLSDDSAK